MILQLMTALKVCHETILANVYFFSQLAGIVACQAYVSKNFYKLIIFIKIIAAILTTPKKPWDDQTNHNRPDPHNIT
jgi:hypothetical protein